MLAILNTVLLSRDIPRNFEHGLLLRFLIYGKNYADNLELDVYTHV